MWRLNAASGLWNNTGHEDRLGKIISDLIISSPYTLLNEGNPTRMNLFNNSESAIDISLISSNLTNCTSWHILNDNIGSDHKPILIKLNVQNSRISKLIFRNKTESIKAINDMSTEPFSNILNFTKEVNNILQQNTTTISIDPRKIPKKWWNDKIERLWLIKRDKQRIYNQKKDLHTALEMKKAINRLKLEIKKAKFNSWNDFVDKMSSMNPNEIWKTIRIIGKPKQHNPILSNHSEAVKFLEYNFPISTEQHCLPLPTSNSSELFTYEELQLVLTKSKNTAPGVDKITYDIIKGLNEEKLNNFLQLLNIEWRKEIYPDTWKNAKIIGIPKQNTTSDRYENLRPISLLSIPSKIMDKMILNRMMSISQNNNLIPPNSFGFIRGRSINELFVNLMSQIEKNKKLKMKNLIIKLDIHKAFDSVNKSTLIDILINKGFSAEYINWIYSMLTNRTVLVNQNYSHTTNNGLPQGSPFSPFLFILYTSSLHELANSNLHIYQFADDIILLLNASNNNELKVHTNTTLTKVKRSIVNIKLSLSANKTQYMRINPTFDPQFIISMDNQIIEESNQLKILGISITNRLSLTPHYKLLKQNAYKNLNLLKTVIHNQRGVHPQKSINIFKATTMAQIKFAQIITNEKRKNINDMAQAIKNNSIRVCTGMTRSTPIPALLAESGQLPNDLENLITTMNFMAKQIHKGSILGDEMINQQSLPKFNNIMAQHSFMSFIAPMQNFIRKKPTNLAVFPNLDNIAKQKSSTEEIKVTFKGMLSNYNQFVRIFTDASKSVDGQGVGIYIENSGGPISEHAINIQGNLSIKTLEAIAIKEAILIVTKNHWKHILILTDSKSTCSALNQDEINPSHFYENCIIQLVRDSSQSFVIQWIPGHSDISGNIKADELAKSAVTSYTDSISQVIPLQDIINLIRQTAYNEWSTKYKNNPKGSFNKNINNDFYHLNHHGLRKIF